MRKGRGKVFGLRNWRNGVTYHYLRMRKKTGKSCFGKDPWEFSFVHEKFKMSFRQQS